MLRNLVLDVFKCQGPGRQSSGEEEQGFLGCLGETQAGAGHMVGGGLDPGMDEGTREWDKKGTRDWAWGMGMRCQSSQ